MSGMEIAINGEIFSLSREAWQRELNPASGELRRNVVWRTSNGAGYTITSRRFVSADQTAAHCAGNHYYATGRRRVSADFNRH